MATKKQPAPARKKTARAGSKAKPVKDQFEGAPTVNIQADYRFSDSEKQELGMQLAGLTQRKEEIAAHKKDLMAQINAQMEECTANIKGVSNKLRSGFETRATDALVIFIPKTGKKEFYHKQTKELIRTEVMLPSDYVQELPMEGLPQSQKPAVPELAPKPKRGKKPVVEQAESKPGETNFGDKLKEAASGVTLPRVPVVLDTDMDSAKVWKMFRKAALTAGWPEAALIVLRDETRKADSVAKMIETLDAHTIRPGATEEPANKPTAETAAE